MLSLVGSQERGSKPSMSKSAPVFSTGQWLSDDGLTLRYREYPGPADRPPVLCIPGLTRNCRDFEPVAEALGGQWRVICADLRGRGASDYARDSSKIGRASRRERG